MGLLTGRRAGRGFPTGRFATIGGWLEAEALGLTVGPLAWVAEPGLRLPGGNGDGFRGAQLAVAGVWVGGGSGAEETIDVAPQEKAVTASVEVGFSSAGRGHPAPGTSRRDALHLGVVGDERWMGDAVVAEEVALLAKVAGGDLGQPLQELFHRYAGRLYALGLGLLGDNGLAEELVQESFVRLWRQAPRYDPARGTVATFVFTLARRIAVDLWRRPSSRPLRADPGPDAFSLWCSDASDEVVNGVVVRRALDSLSRTHREVIELSYGGGLTQVEIARRVGVPLGTVKTRTYHALRALKVQLESQGVDA